MDMILDNEETVEAVRFYIEHQYKIQRASDATVGITKQPKTGHLTTTVSIPYAGATASSKSCCNNTEATATSYESEPDSDDNPNDSDSGLDFPDSVGSDKSTDSMFG